jgi:hypothetical protein
MGNAQLVALEEATGKSRRLLAGYFDTYGLEVLFWV